MSSVAAGWWLWWRSRRPWVQFSAAVFLTVETVGVALVLFAPEAAASVGGVLGFTGIRNSHDVPLTSIMYVPSDDTLMDWNGVLPRINPHVGAGISAGIGNWAGRLVTALIVVTAGFMLWLLRALRSGVWNELFGSVFSAIGFSIDKIVTSAPLLSLAILIGTAAGVVMIGVGRGTGGRATIATTWLIGIVGVGFGHSVLARLLAPAGWIEQVRSAGSEISAALISQGRHISSAASAVTGWLDRMEVGFADGITDALQDWMLGTTLSTAGGKSAAGVQGSYAACAQAWDTGQRSGNSAMLGHLIQEQCPATVTAHIGDAGVIDGLFLWAVILGSLGTGAWFAWCGLMCLFRVNFYGAFAPAFILYGVIPSFPRRFLKLAGSDFVVQLLSYGIYIVLTGAYVLALMTTWQLPAAKIGGWAGPVPRLMVTAVVMIALVEAVRHVAKLHRAAMAAPASGSASPAAAAGRLAAAAGGAAALGTSGAAAYRAAAGATGSGGAVSNRSTAARINAGLSAAQTALSRAHPVAGAVGALAGGLGPPAAQRAVASVQAASGSGGGNWSPASSGSGGSRGGGSRAVPAARGAGENLRDRAAARASDIRASAAQLARQSAIGRRGTAAPVRGSASGLRV